MMMPANLNDVIAGAWSGWIATGPTRILALIWFAWLVSWIVGSLWTARTEKHVRTWDSRAYRLPILAGGLLMTPWVAEALDEQTLWHLSANAIYALAGVTLAGTLFTWWARLHLGRFWSNAITRKEGHRVVDTGPYGIVRHPIYTGLIAAIFATGIAVATLCSILGALLIALGLWQKARMEEGFLTTELGHEVYSPYRIRVPMLCPSPFRRRAS